MHSLIKCSKAPFIIRYNSIAISIGSTEEEKAYLDNEDILALAVDTTGYQLLYFKPFSFNSSSILQATADFHCIVAIAFRIAFIIVDTFVTAITMECCRSYSMQPYYQACSAVADLEGTFHVGFNY